MPIVEINKLMICFAVKMHIQFFFSVIGEFRAEHLVNQLLVTFRNIIGNRLSIIATSANVAFRKAIHKTSYQIAATESRVVYHVVEHTVDTQGRCSYRAFSALSFPLWLCR